MRVRIVKSSKRDFECRDLATGETIIATALGKLLKDGEIVVGDFAEVERQGETFVIVEVKKRKNELHRYIVREAKKKIFAANCDCLIIVTSVSRPEYKRGLIDRYLIRALDWNITPIVVFNKMDEYNEKDFCEDGLKFEAARVAGFGTKCFEISAKDINYKAQILSQGFNELKDYLKGKTAVLAGQSGVGKSQLVFKLFDEKFDVSIGEISEASQKGSHTTTWATLFETNDLSIIDLPGLRSFALDDISKDELMSFFPDIADISAMCKFTNCTHDEDSVGCAFYEKFKSDELLSKLIFSRLESYKRILEEIS